VTTTFYLIRHAAHDNVGGFLAGRMPGIRLGIDGRAQAERLGERMRRERFDVIIASPRERTQETAQAIGTACGLPIDTDARLDEVDFGTWAGKDFDTLNQDEHWRRWNAMRSLNRTPTGESMLDVQHRVLAAMAAAEERFPGGRIVLVSHSDPIKTAISHVLGLPIDAWPRFEISPASISLAVIGTWGGKVITLNEVID
jgi:broad specificity phosphatase PhoE